MGKTMDKPVTSSEFAVAVATQQEFIWNIPNSKPEFCLWWKECNTQIKSKRKQVRQEISYAVKECSSEKKLSCIIWSSHFSLSTELKPWCLLAKNFSTILFRITDSTESDIVVDALRELECANKAEMVFVFIYLYLT